MTQTLEAPVQVPFTFTALTTCDRHPSARAYTRFYKAEKELLFCGHCYSNLMPSFAEQGWAVDNQLNILEKEIESFNAKSSDSDF